MKLEYIILYGAAIDFLQPTRYNLSRSIQEINSIFILS